MSETNRPAPILPPDAEGIARATALLQAGGVVALPTETVYGLAARADCEAAVAQVYRLKGRPSFNPLIVHVPGIAEAEALAHLDARARMLAQRFWPGPLTLVLPLRDGAGIVPAVTAGLPTVALRSPAHPLARAVLEAVGAPLAAPSANRSLAVSPTRPAHVVSSFGTAAPPILDGGACPQGLESSIVALREGGGWALLRPGPITRGALVALLGPPEDARGGAIEAPGQLARHYSPGKPLRLDASSAAADEFHLGFGAVPGDWSLSPSGDPAEAAARLYAGLHRAAAAEQPRIAVAPLPHDGIGEAMLDRLRRAAAG